MNTVIIPESSPKINVKQLHVTCSTIPWNSQINFQVVWTLKSVWKVFLHFGWRWFGLPIELQIQTVLQVIFRAKWISPTPLTATRCSENKHWLNSLLSINFNSLRCSWFCSKSKPTLQHKSNYSSLALNYIRGISCWYFCLVCFT